MQQELSDKSESKSIGGLQSLIGDWDGQGQSWGSQDADAVRVTMARDHFEWLEGKQFVVHRWEWHLGTNTFQGIELLGWDAEKKSFFATMYDNAGHRVTYDVQAKDGAFTYKGERQKAKIVVSVDGQHMSSQWQASKDGTNWFQLCDMEWQLRGSTQLS